MKSFTFVLLGAATAVFAEQQKVIQDPLNTTDSWLNLQETVNELTSEAKALWEDFPDLVESLTQVYTPKPNFRKPDSAWDFVVKGKDIKGPSAHASGTHGETSDGGIDMYSLRAKKIDPSKLGIDTVKQYSGYLDDDKNDKHLFYWFFESRNDPKNDPVILWLNGGPGCSSLTGLFLELGPASVDKNLKIINNPYSWNTNASVIFLDQPVNVGYSYSGKSVSNTVAAGKDIYALLTLFFEQFPEYSSQDFHIAGESYAGHYIPDFASEILSHKDRNINLKSVLIGNGLTDVYTQYEYYRPMACGKGGYPAVLSESECKAMDDALPRCQSLIQSCYDHNSFWTCVPAGIYCNNAMIGPYQRSGQNVYDVRTPCEDPKNLCYPALAWISEYLNKSEVKRELGVEVDNYESCNNKINRNFLFHGDWTQPFHRLVPQILAEIPVLIYAGDADFICNWLGNQAWTEVLEWPGQESFQKSKVFDVKLDNGHKYGKIKSNGRLAFLQVFGAGHMVPLNQPEASLNFLNRWVNGDFGA